MERVCQDQDPDTWTGVTSDLNQDNDVHCESDVTDSDDEVEAENPIAVQLETNNKRSFNNINCMTPTFGPDIETHELLIIAPGEGNKPVSVSKEPNWEGMAFPGLFPDGKGTFNNPSTPHSVPISAKKYINACLLSSDS